MLVMLIRCGICGSSMVVIGGTDAFRAYGRAGNKDGGNAVCANGIRVRQSIVESRLLGPIKDELLTSEKLEALRRRVAQKAATVPKAANPAQCIAELRRQIENLADAIATGGLKASPALVDRLTVAKEELARLVGQAAKPVAKIVDLPARIMARFRTMVEMLEVYLARDPHLRAQRCERSAVKSLCFRTNQVNSWWRSSGSASCFSERQ